VGAAKTIAKVEAAVEADVVVVGSVGGTDVATIGGAISRVRYI